MQVYFGVGGKMVTKSPRFACYLRGVVPTRVRIMRARFPKTAQFRLRARERGPSGLVGKPVHDLYPPPHLDRPRHHAGALGASMVAAYLAAKRE